MSVKFEGQVSGQVAPGENVIIHVTKPDATGFDKLAPTQADKSFLYTLTDALPMGPGYTAQARVDADSAYKAVLGPIVPFEVGLDRTITLTVTNVP